MRRCSGKVDQGNITSEDQEVTPRKINIEPENDDFPLSKGVFSCSMLIFRGVPGGSYQDVHVSG